MKQTNMKKHWIEAQFSKNYRFKEVKAVKTYISKRLSVELIGMKRVGISNFLRYYLSHHTNEKSDITNDFYILVDLNYLSERELGYFWRLCLKSIIDRALDLNLSTELKKRIKEAAQSLKETDDLLQVMGEITAILSLIAESGYMPTLVFLRFDRLKKALSAELYDNLKGLRDALGQKLSYIFTSDRSLEELSPALVYQPSLSLLIKKLYICPVSEKDSVHFIDVYEKHFSLNLPKQTKHKIIELSGGHIQYMYLMLVIAHEINTYEKKVSNIFDELLKDERILLQSEELYKRLTATEQSVVWKAFENKEVTFEDKEKAPYLWNTQLLKTGKNGAAIFSPLFHHYLDSIKKHKNVNTFTYTHKEQILFDLLHTHAGKVVDRKEIIDTVWSEFNDIGISDWAIDRLVARLRVKLKKLHPHFEVRTVRSRGFMLLTDSRV